MLHAKLRRTAASAILVAAVSLVPVQTAGAMPRGGGEREGGRSSQRIVDRWQLAAWNFLVGLLEKAGLQINPDGGW